MTSTQAQEQTSPDTTTADEVAQRTGGKELLAGGSILAGAMLAANAGNYILNVLLGRWLTPAEFADANLMVTLMLLVTAIAISLSLISARFAGIHHVTGEADRTDALAIRLEKWAWLGGFAILAVLVGGASFWRDFFNSESAVPFIILGLGMPFYLVQAVGRGVMQGRLNFRPLAFTFIIEMIVRVTTGVVLVAAGLGVEGATIGLTASFVVTWAAVSRLTTGRTPGTMTSDELKALASYAGPVALLLLGQIIINNGDVLIAKRFLEPETAGVYAAIALIGRAVFFLSWSVATTLFPAVAQRNEAGHDSNGLLHGGLAVVAMLGLVAVIGARTLGGIVLGQVFGPEYSDVASPLAWYAFATTLFAMANLIVSHHLSTGRIREAGLLLAGSVVQTSLLFAGRGSIDSLIQAQVIAMSILLFVVGASHLWSQQSTPQASAAHAAQRSSSAATDSIQPLKRATS